MAPEEARRLTNGARLRLDSSVTLLKPVVRLSSGWVRSLRKRELKEMRIGEGGSGRTAVRRDRRVQQVD